MTDAMLREIADTTRNDALAEGATEEEVHATCETTFAIVKSEKYQAPRQP